jgi:hypothetical protein
MLEIMSNPGQSATGNIKSMKTLSEPIGSRTRDLKDYGTMTQSNMLTLD